MQETEFQIPGSGNPSERKFGGAGGVCKLVNSYHCIQHGQYLIVSSYSEHSIRIFNLDGEIIARFGKQGSKDEESNRPYYLSVNKEGLITNGLSVMKEIKSPVRYLN